MKKTVSILLALVLSLGLFACGGGGPSIVGKWSMTIEEAGVTGEMIYEFTADGKLKISVDTGNAENDKMLNEMFSEYEINYEAKDGKLTTKSDAPDFDAFSEVPYTIKDDTLSIEDETLKRVK